MISGRGWAAVIAEEVFDQDEKPKKIWHQEQIVFFDDQSYGWIAPANGGLRNAERVRGFEGYVQSEDLIQIMPANGLRARYKLDEGGCDDEPIVAWGLRADGIVVALVSDGCGGLDEVSIVNNFESVHGPSDD